MSFLGGHCRRASSGRLGGRGNAVTVPRWKRLLAVTVRRGLAEDFAELLQVHSLRANPGRHPAVVWVNGAVAVDQLGASCLGPSYRSGACD